MDNKSIVVKSNSDDWRDAAEEIYRDEIICINNRDFSERALLRFYEEFISDYNELPSVVDLCDEIMFHNNDKITAIAELFAEFDSQAINMAAHLRLQKYKGNFVFIDENAVMEEVLSQITSDLCDSLNNEYSDYARSDISELLNRYDLSFFMDDNDDIYTGLEFIYEAGNIIIANDCQIQLFPGGLGSFFDQAYNSHTVIGDRYGATYSVIKRYDKRRSGDFKQLGYQVGW